MYFLLFFYFHNYFLMLKIFVPILKYKQQSTNEFKSGQDKYIEFSECRLFGFSSIKPYVNPAAYLYLLFTRIFI